MHRYLVALGSNVRHARHGPPHRVIAAGSLIYGAGLLLTGLSQGPASLVLTLGGVVGIGMSLLTLPVVLYAARPFFEGAWRSLRHRSPGMDLPVALGIGAAFAASVWATWRCTPWACRWCRCVRPAGR